MLCIATTMRNNISSLFWQTVPCRSNVKLYCSLSQESSRASTLSIHKFASLTESGKCPLTATAFQLAALPWCIFESAQTLRHWRKTLALYIIELWEYDTQQPAMICFSITWNPKPDKSWQSHKHKECVWKFRVGFSRPHRSESWISTWPSMEFKTGCPIFCTMCVSRNPSNESVACLGCHGWLLIHSFGALVTVLFIFQYGCIS